MKSLHFAAVALVCLLPGCVATDAPTTRPAATGVESGSEQGILSDVIQVTSGYACAGEAYFSPDMKWVIFQAAPPGEEHYQMFVAKFRRSGDDIVGIEPPTRISAPNSRNTCGWFSPD